MAKFENLLSEAEVIQRAWGYGVLEAIQYISEMQDQYPIEVQRELREFMDDGRRMLAPRRAA